jgi:hypothetical protein
MFRNALVSIVVLASLLVRSAEAAAGEQRFDLVCTGLVTISAPTNSPPPRVETTRLRIDLIGRRWCEDRCAIINTISAVDRQLIQLNEADYPAYGVMAHPVGTRTINRITGVYSWFITVGQVVGGGDQACKQAPFTPIPSPKF